MASCSAAVREKFLPTVLACLRLCCRTLAWAWSSAIPTRTTWEVAEHTSYSLGWHQAGWAAGVHGSVGGSQELQQSPEPTRVAKMDTNQIAAWCQETQALPEGCAERCIAGGSSERQSLSAEGEQDRIVSVTTRKKAEIKKCSLAVGVMLCKKRPCWLDVALAKCPAAATDSRQGLICLVLKVPLASVSDGK